MFFVHVYSATDLYYNTTDTLTMYNCHLEYIEHVVVTIKFDSSYRGSVRIYLESPDGTNTKLLR